jgi:hypothetical protein
MAAAKAHGSTPNDAKPGRQKKREEWVDISWALINSMEFLHRH